MCREKSSLEMIPRIHALNFGAGNRVEKRKNDLSREWCVKHYGGYEDPNGAGRWTYGE